jgi:hypothetical protein
MVWEMDVSNVSCFVTASWVNLLEISPIRQLLAILGNYLFITPLSVISLGTEGPKDQPGRTLGPLEPK